MESFINFGLNSLRCFPKNDRLNSAQPLSHLPQAELRGSPENGPFLNDEIKLLQLSIMILKDSMPNFILNFFQKGIPIPPF